MLRSLVGSEMCIRDRAWLISETAMEIILHVAYPDRSLSEVQGALRRYKGMVPHELLLNPETGRKEWDKIAFLIKDYFNLYKKYITTHQHLKEANGACLEAQQKYEDSNKKHCDLDAKYVTLSAISAARQATTKLLRARMDKYVIPHNDIL
eukprot:TRINITY_DN4539_c0_g1_i5.p1 TRINITY_DN4539_c0_g1~~TRINITY_DN4539_c0_g1_i5.p1  ORF type:complete len:176 (+),score=38.28 TRINITY_DN4539_c0_g1_i5:78-530(+)